MVPTPQRPALPPPDYRRGVTMGAAVGVACGVLGWAAGEAAARVILATGWPAWWGVAFGPVLTLALVILAGVALYLPSRGRSRAYGRGATMSILALAVLWFGSRTLGATMAALIVSTGLPPWSRLILVALPAALLALALLAAILAHGRHLDHITPHHKEKQSSTELMGRGRQ